MTKQQQFIALVQTAFLANGINLSLEPDARERRHLFSASSSLIYMSEALRAAERIPEEMTAADAADDFAGYMLENLQEPDASVPHWFAKGTS